MLALANGLAGNARISEPGPDLDVLETALTDLFGELARAMAADGEGATKMMEVVVTGAPTDAIARECALAITSSPLVKAAVFGADPNWGRILSTVGARAGSQNWPVDPFRAARAAPGRPGVPARRARRLRSRGAARADAGDPDRRPRRARRRGAPAPRRGAATSPTTT